MANQKNRRFMLDQIEEILKHKWIEGEKSGKDPGPECCLEWIENHGEEYRNWWEAENEFL